MALRNHNWACLGSSSSPCECWDTLGPTSWIKTLPHSLSHLPGAAGPENPPCEHPCLGLCDPLCPRDHPAGSGGSGLLSELLAVVFLEHSGCKGWLGWHGQSCSGALDISLATLPWAAGSFSPSSAAVTASQSGLGWKGPQSPISATPAVGRDTFHSSRMLQAPPAWPWTLLGVRHSLCVGSVSWDRQGWFVALGL